MDIKDKVVIVTGASSGIGLETAKLFSEQGAKVVLVARSKDKLEQLAGKLPGSLALSVDITDHQAIDVLIKDVMSKCGRIDILINNAGRGYDAPIEQTDTAMFNQIIDLDLMSPLYAMQQVIPIMKKQKMGSIINISSGTALMNLPNMGAYAATKAALAHLSLTARNELAKYNISVGVVYPYITETNFEKNTIKGSSEHFGPNDSNGYQPPKADSAEFVAEKILEAVKTGSPEIYAHAWMEGGE
jgi:short-subunit dehydrogenase